MISDVTKLSDYRSPSPKNIMVMALYAGKTLYIVKEIRTGAATLKDTVSGFLQRHLENEA